VIPGSARNEIFKPTITPNRTRSLALNSKGFSFCVFPLAPFFRTIRSFPSNVTFGSARGSLRELESWTESIDFVDIRVSLRAKTQTERERERESHARTSQYLRTHARRFESAASSSRFLRSGVILEGSSVFRAERPRARDGNSFHMEAHVAARPIYNVIYPGAGRRRGRSIFSAGDPPFSSAVS